MVFIFVHAVNKRAVPDMSWPKTNLPRTKAFLRQPFQISGKENLPGSNGKRARCERVLGNLFAQGFYVGNHVDPHHKRKHSEA
jgi:hypothetical protein